MGYNKRPLVLGFNDNTLIPSGLVEVILNLSDNGDVCNTQPSNHQVLAWTGSNWCGSSIQFPTGGGTSFTCSSLSSCDLSALSNVCSNGPGTNDVLAWNGTKWCPSSLPNTVPPPLPAGSPGDILVVKEGATAFATSLASGTLITNAIADQNIVVDGDLTAYVAKSQSSSDGEVLVSRGSGGFTGKIASGTLFDEGIADKNIVVDGDLAAYAAKGSGNTFTQTNVFQGETQLGTTTTKVDTDGNLTVDGNIDLIGTGHKLTIDDTIIDQDKAVLANVIANSVMISNDVSAASSVSGASGTVLYFEGDPVRPGVQTINTILTNANYNISPNDSYLTTTNVKPPDVGMSSDGHMTFRTNATTFGTIASNANARTFITTDANFENLTNVTGISDTDDIADGSPLFWSKTHGTFSAIMEAEADTPGTTQTNFLNLTASGGLTVEGDSVQKSVSSTSVTAIDIAAPGSVSSAGVSGVNGAITSAPTTGNHIANKTYVDGINNTQHNRLFAVGTKTDSIANTSVYLGWEFDVPNALSVSDSGGVITLGGTGNTEITFGAAGDYMIDCTARCNANNRVELLVKAEYYDATQESPAFATYNRFQSSNYAARDTDQNTGGTTLGLLLSLNQNDKLRFSAEGDSDGTCVLLVNGTFLRIVKLA